MTKIYDQHKAAFGNVSAYVITNITGAQIGNIAFKLPKDGAGRLYCYFHIHGLEMVRGFAGGYGYDKRSAAVADAINKFTKIVPLDLHAIKLSALTKKMDAGDWKRVLEDAGYNVLQAV